MKTIIINGIEIEIEKKKIKNMYIRIAATDGSVKITAPYSMPYFEAERFAKRKIEWILKNKRTLPDKAGAKKEFVSGEKHLLWGKEYTLKVQEGNKEGVHQAGEFIVLNVRKGSDIDKRRLLMNKWYRSVLKERIEMQIIECAEIVGASPAEWRIKNMKTRWGTCNIAQKRIWLNLQLVKLSPECLRYVIIHELTHLHEKKHNENFKAYMDWFCPEWREIKRNMRMPF